jgi:oxygen-independent coproporphyrinogen-3 oxidase
MAATLIPARSLGASGASDVRAGRLRAGEPLGVYVHFPFCGVRCPYCDFAVDTRPEIPHDEYAAAVAAELAARADWFEGAGPLVSIYFGGGTPGLWRPDALGRVIEAARAAFGAPDPSALEITVEANPGETDQAHLGALRRLGVGRLSLGLQAIEDRLLAALGRNHDATAGTAAFGAARAAGFENVSVDLIYGVPGQSLDDWRRAVDAVVALAPEHVSAYALTVERGTAFGSLERAGRLDRPDDEITAAMYEHARGGLAAAGLAAYEISSYARPGRQSRHNRLYWALAPTLGVGVSAASFRPLDDGTAWRFSNARSTEVYLREARAGRLATPRKSERRTAADLANEALWLGLRTIEGIDRRAFQARHGADPLAGREAEAMRAAAAGWLAADDDQLRLTEAGALFADEIAARLWL